jgi:hypothetical protein
MPVALKDSSYHDIKKLFLSPKENALVVLGAGSNYPCGACSGGFTLLKKRKPAPAVRRKK